MLDYESCGEAQHARALQYKVQHDSTCVNNIKDFIFDNANILQ